MIRRLALLALLLVATGVHAAPAERRVAVLAPAPAWLDALEVALEPWGVELVVVDGEAPAGDPAAQTAAAAALAARARAGVVLWIGAGATGGAWLWLYDADTGQLSVRPLPAGAPDTPEPAAAAALTAKTMLRLTVAAPPPQRFGAVVAREARPRWFVDVGLDLHLLDAGPTEETLVAQSIGLSWWPGRLGVSVFVASGPGFAVDDPRLIARFGRSTAGARVRARLRLPHRLRLEGDVSLGVHLTSLDGTAPASATSIAVSRTDASLGAAAALVVPAGDVELSIIVGLDVALRRQRYLLGGDPLLELPAVEPFLGLRASLPIR